MVRILKNITSAPKRVRRSLCTVPGALHRPGGKWRLENALCRRSGQPQSEHYDMVVLSVGLEIDPDTKNLATKLGLDLNQYNFAVTDVFAPVTTSRPGVYTCGLLQAPKDIPSSVTEASAAACAAGIELAEARGTQVKPRELPAELDVADQPPRIGVFVCNCGINIASVVDVKEVAEYAGTLPNVVYIGDNLFTCSQDTQEKIRKVIEENT